MKILVLCNATVGQRMASPGIRSYHIARTLASALPDARVTLAHRGDTDLDPAGRAFHMVRWDHRNLASLARSHDIIIANHFPTRLFPLALRKLLVLDLYTPFFTEWREFSKVSRTPREHEAYMAFKQHELLSQIAIADFVLCANERQRDLYVGILSSMGVISTRGYDLDTSFRSVIAVAPFGVRPQPPVARRRRLKGVHPSIREQDTLIIWNGSIFEWYDVETLLRAVHRLSLERDDIKLFFMGAEHPDFRAKEPLTGMGSGSVHTALDLSCELGILDRFVFFNLGWASEEESDDYLLESDIGVCTYRDSLETRYSFRVRYLDLFWAGVPIVCTRGDVVADMVETRGLGVTVDEGDVDGVVAAISRLADDAAFRASCKAQLVKIRDEFNWESALSPLISFCRKPRPLTIRKRERLMPALTQISGWAAAAARLAAVARRRPTTKV